MMNANMFNLLIRNILNLFLSEMKEGNSSPHSLRYLAETLNIVCNAAHTAHCFMGETDE